MYFGMYPKDVPPIVFDRELTSESPLSSEVPVDRPELVDLLLLVVDDPVLLLPLENAPNCFLIDE